MANKLIDIEGIGATYARTLAEAGLTNTDDLMDAASSSAGRKSLAVQTGLDESRILEWVNRADLMRIKGIGSEYSDLLEAARVNSVKELAQQVPADLAAKLAHVNEAKKLVRRVPTKPELTRWIIEAKSMPSLVSDEGMARLPSMRRVPSGSVSPGVDDEDKSRRLEAFRRAAGSWSDVDTDNLVAEIYRRRHGADRPPVNL